jgi:hypothetical protein
MKELGTYLSIVFKVMRGVWDMTRKLVDGMGGFDKAIRVLSIGLGLLAGARMASGILKLLSLFKLLGPALGMLMSPIGLLTAGLLALILIVQDLFSEDSVIKEWMETFQEDFPNLAGLAQDFVDVMVSGAGLIAEGWQNIWTWIQPIKDFFSSDLLTGAMSKLESIAGFLRGGGIGEKLFDIKEMIFGPAGGITPTSPGAAGAAGASTQNNQMTANVVVQVPPGMGAKQASEVVSSGVEDGFTSMLRNTRNQSLGGVAY